MNRKTLLLILLLFITGILIIPFVIVVKWHLQMTNFKEGTVGEYDSFDGHYTMYMVVEEDYTKLHYVNISLVDNIMEEEVFSIKNEYRAFDFHWVVWENKSYNFWLKSGDIGTFYYEFKGDNNTWIKYGVVKAGEKYYELRESMGSVEKTIDMDEVKKRLPKEYYLD